MGFHLPYQIYAGINWISILLIQMRKDFSSSWHQGYTSQERSGDGSPCVWCCTHGGQGQLWFCPIPTVLPVQFFQLQNHTWFLWLVLSVRAVRRDTKRACDWRWLQTPITEKRCTKLRWEHLRSKHSHHRCVPNSYASLHPYSAIRTTRKKLVVSQRRYERTCKRIADSNVTFCKRGGAAAWANSDFCKKSEQEIYT